MLPFTTHHFPLVPSPFPPPLLHVTTSFAGMRRLLPPARRVSVRRCGGVVKRCRGSDLEGDWALEAEILEFMKGSEKPGAFPSRRELVEAGRLDLAEAIVREGGWLSMGWDLGVEDESGFRNWNDEYGSSGDELTISDDDSSSSPAASSSGRSL